MCGAGKVTRPRLGATERSASTTNLLADAEPGKLGCYGRLQQKPWWVGAVEFIGTLAGAGTTFSFVPQAYQTIVTDDVDGLSLGMYLMFVSGVFLWMARRLPPRAPLPLPAAAGLPAPRRVPTARADGAPAAARQLYGFLKKAWPLVVSNVVTFCLSGLILVIILTHVLAPPPPPGQIPVAVCLAGAAETFAHPRVQRGIAESLLQPGWHLFTALETTRLRADRASEGQSSLGTLPFVEAALAALAREGAAVSGTRFYDGARDTRELNCSAARGAADAAAVGVAYAAQLCVDMVEDAEERLNMTFAFVVRARPDLLWESPLPRVDSWFPSRVLASSNGDDKLAIVPRAALRSYFGAYHLLESGCPMLKRTAQNEAALPSDAHCWMAEHQLRDCLFRVRPAVDAIETGKVYKSGEHVWSPNIAYECHRGRTGAHEQQRRALVQRRQLGPRRAADEAAGGQPAPGRETALADRVSQLEQSLATLMAREPSGAASTPTSLAVARDAADLRYAVECV